MTLKIKLFNKNSHDECDDIILWQELTRKIAPILAAYSNYEYKISIYGEIIPIGK